MVLPKDPLENQMTHLKEFILQTNKCEKTPASVKIKTHEGPSTLKQRPSIQTRQRRLNEFKTHIWAVPQRVHNTMEPIMDYPSFI